MAIAGISYVYARVVGPRMREAVLWRDAELETHANVRRSSLAINARSCAKDIDSERGSIALLRY